MRDWQVREAAEEELAAEHMAVLVKNFCREVYEKKKKKRKTVNVLRIEGNPTTQALLRTKKATYSQ